MVKEFDVGDRVVCVVREHDRYTYGDELYMHGATVTLPPQVVWPDMLWVEWDKPCSRSNGGYHKAAFEPLGGPW